MSQIINYKERFEESFVVTPGCWLWTGSKNWCGYGMFYMGGKTYRAHRLSLGLYSQTINSSDVVCHKCDVPACVNPDHLFVGTQTDNMKDMWIKNRGARGNASGRRKLNEDQVKEILCDTRKQCDIAKFYGVDPSLISLIKTRKQWRHL